MLARAFNPLLFSLSKAALQASWLNSILRFNDSFQFKLLLPAQGYQNSLAKNLKAIKVNLCFCIYSVPMHCTVRLFEQNKTCFSITFQYNLSSEMSANPMAIKTLTRLANSINIINPKPSRRYMLVSDERVNGTFQNVTKEINKKRQKRRGIQITRRELTTC